MAKAKFGCASVSNDANGMQEVYLVATTDDEGDNDFCEGKEALGEAVIKITPNAKGKDFFVPGQKYLLDITPEAQVEN